MNRHICALWSLTFAIATIGCGLAPGSGPYGDLVSTFGSGPKLSSKPIPSRTIVLVSPHHRGAFNYRDIVDIRLSSKVIEFDPSFPMMRRVQIPIDKITGCSMTCFGSSNWDADLLIAETGTEISIEKSKEIFDWCWEHRIPMVSAKDENAWMYSHAKLPDKSSYAKQLSSYEEWEHQRKQACCGY